IKQAQKDDAFQWPPVDVANLEAMDLDRNVIVSLPAVAEPAAERDEQTARDGPQRDKRAAREDSVRRTWTSRRNRWIDTARRWAVPVLAALVLIESSWLVRQNLRDRSRVAA